MGAAKYVGRVGGLAVALGVGVGIFIGAGLASADAGSDGSSSGNSASTSSSSTSSSTSDAGGAGTTSSPSDPAGDPASTSTSTRTKASADVTPPRSNARRAAHDRQRSARIAATASPDTPDSDTPDSDTTDSDTTESVPDKSARAAKAADTPTAATTAATTPTAGDVLSPRTWLASPLAAAARAVSTPLAAAPQLASVSPIVPASLTSPLTLLSEPVPGVPAGSPVEWLLATATSFGLTEPLDQIAVDANSLDISYNPALALSNGVITGTNPNPNPTVSPNGLPLEYTVQRDPSGGGKISLDPTNGNFTFLPDTATVTTRGTEKFTVLITEVTAFNTALYDIPILGLFAKPVILRLHTTPILSDALAPLIGGAYSAPVDVNVADIVPVGAPVAYTLMVTSFDGTQISTNWFPATGLQAGQQAPTVLNGPGLATPGNTDPESETIVVELVPGLKPLRDAGYNVVTWDPRGEFISTGILNLDSPFFEGRDVSAIIDYVSTLSATEKEDGDPLIGMVGGSYGGGIQLVTAAIDPRVDAIVPVIAWNSQLTSLYPNNAFKTSFSTLLLLSLITTGSRINSQLYSGVLYGSVLGYLTNSQQAFLSGHGPSVLVNNITAPTLLIQGSYDVLFPLEEAVTNAEMLDANGVPVSMIWACGGHGKCLDPINPQQTTFLIDTTINWLDTYVKGEHQPTGQKFRWVDQTGQYYAADLLPSNPDFYADPITTVSAGGGTIPIVPVLFGSGPEALGGFPLSLTLGAPADVAVKIPLDAPTEETFVVGKPKVTLTYSGLGTGRHVYGQIVDKKTNQVLGTLVTPIEVTLDGRTHTATVDLENIAYTMDPDSELELQLVGSATAFEHITSYGVINVESVTVEMPVAAQAIPISLPSSTPIIPIAATAAA